jgi:hypothetical protein
MERQPLPWWRGPAWLEGENICLDAAAAEPHDAAQLGPEVLFDLAAVTNAREAVDFVSHYGFLLTGPTDPPDPLYEPADWTLTRADQFRVELGRIARQQQSILVGERLRSRPENAQEALHTMTATLFASPASPPETLLDIVKRCYQALSEARVLLGRCPTCGRFFARQDRGPNARYCRRACAATAAKWRERRAELVR